MPSAYGRAIVVAGFAVSRAVEPSVGSALFNISASGTAAFGLEREPFDILSSDPVFVRVRRLLLIVVSGLLTAAPWSSRSRGSVFVRDRRGRIALTVAGMAVIPFWWVALLPYVRAGIPLTPLHIPRS